MSRAKMDILSIPVKEEGPEPVPVPHAGGAEGCDWKLAGLKTGKGGVDPDPRLLPIDPMYIYIYM
jgi:hypothetical protein